MGDGRGHLVCWQVSEQGDGEEWIDLDGSNIGRMELAFEKAVSRAVRAGLGLKVPPASSGNTLLLDGRYVVAFGNKVRLFGRASGDLGRVRRLISPLPKPYISGVCGGGVVVSSAAPEWVETSTAIAVNAAAAATDPMQSPASVLPPSATAAAAPGPALTPSGELVSAATGETTTWQFSRRCGGGAWLDNTGANALQLDCAFALYEELSAAASKAQEAQGVPPPAAAAGGWSSQR